MPRLCPRSCVPVSPLESLGLDSRPPLACFIPGERDAQTRLRALGSRPSRLDELYVWATLPDERPRYVERNDRTESGAQANYLLERLCSRPAAGEWQLCSPRGQPRRGLILSGP